MQVQEQGDDVPRPFGHGRSAVTDRPRERHDAPRVGVERQGGGIAPSAGALGQSDRLEARPSPLVFGPVVQGDREREGRLVHVRGEGVLRALLVAVVLDNERIVRPEVVRALDLLGIPPREHGEQVRLEAGVEPLQQFRNVLHGHVRRGRLSVTGRRPSAVIRRVLFRDLDRAGALVPRQQGFPRHLDPRPVAPSRPRHRSKVLGLLRNLVRVERTVQGARIRAPRGRAPEVLGRVSRDGRVRSAQHLVAGGGEVAEAEDFFDLGVVPHLHQHRSQFEPRPGVGRGRRHLLHLGLQGPVEHLVLLRRGLGAEAPRSPAAAAAGPTMRSRDSLLPVLSAERRGGHIAVLRIGTFVAGVVRTIEPDGPIRIRGSVRRATGRSDIVPRRLGPLEIREGEPTRDGSTSIRIRERSPDSSASRASSIFSPLPSIPEGTFLWPDRTAPSPIIIWARELEAEAEATLRQSMPTGTRTITRRTTTLPTAILRNRRAFAPNFTRRGWTKSTGTIGSRSIRTIPRC
mmetsp:Transcript_35862/g.107059  ORF Transcript_35862/g.107059 Transcript_35862/m.107059 type:complete len:516 (+) Transcript_35862:589-2136(+)